MVHGLTFIAVAHSTVSEKMWREEERAQKIRLDRHRRLILRLHERHQDKLSEDERETLASIDRQLGDDHAVESEKSCPECHRPFRVVTIKRVEIDCCRFCRSIWFDPGELQVFSGEEKEIPSDHLKSRKSRYNCPVCRAEMTEYVFVNPCTLLVDRCPNGHGVYLEDRELERVFEIV